MNKKTAGAWLINHTHKLNSVTQTADFDDIEVAGKCGIFLSNLSASEDSTLNANTVATIASESGLKKTEVQAIKDLLEKAHLIDVAHNGSIFVSGVTSASVLTHTAEIFKDMEPNSYQRAALELSDSVSDAPRTEKDLHEYISDKFKLAKDETRDLFHQSAEMGFVDFENLDDKSALYFNGNLFKRDNLEKTNKVLASLSPEDVRKLNEVDEAVKTGGIITIEKAIAILGQPLWSKAITISMYELNEVSNELESKTFVTKPSAFQKFGNPFEEDALDLAKAFVSALFYGMNFSDPSRGKIDYLEVLIRKLVNGYEIGPATAIGNDYKLLEIKRVVQIRHDGQWKYYMTLLKKDVGELALQVLSFGEAIEETMKASISSAGSVTKYVGPESKRTTVRKTQNQASKTRTANTLRTLRA